MTNYLQDVLIYDGAGASAVIPHHDYRQGIGHKARKAKKAKRRQQNQSRRKR